MDEQLERKQAQQATKMLLFSVWIDVAIGIAALLWGDSLFPKPTPTVLGLGIGTIIGLSFLLVAAPVSFAAYYFRRRQDAARYPVPRGPVEKL